jgi:hypothetical protein
MIDYERAKQITVEASNENVCAAEFKEALGDLSVTTVTEAARLTVHEALRIYRIKVWSAERAGIDVHGADRTLQLLAERNEDETVMLFLFEDTSRSYFVFLSESEESFIGCMSVPRRFPDPDVDWSTGGPVRRDAKKI